MTKVTPSDVLRLLGLFDSCNILNLHSFVGANKAFTPHPA